MPDNTTTQTTPGVMPTITNRDNSTINDGGRAGTHTTVTLATNHAPASFTQAPAPISRTAFESASRTPFTPPTNPTAPYSN